MNHAEEVPLDRAPRPGERMGVFCAVTAWSRIYRDYDGVPEAERNRLHAVVLMVDRWDGRVGFPGGLVGEGEAPLDALLRELAEEVGEGLRLPGMAPLVAHESGGMLLRLYLVELGVVDPDDLLSILSRAAHARDALAEGFAVWRHFADYGGRRGLPTLRAANNLAPAVGEEIDAVAAALAGSAPPGSAPVLPPTVDDRCG